MTVKSIHKAVAKPTETKSARAVNPLQKTSSISYEAHFAHVEFLNANANVKIAGELPAAAKVNYFVGKAPSGWRSNMTAYGRVRYTDLYPGIDLIFYGGPGQKLEYDLVLAPGADPALIRMKIAGESKAVIDPAGSLRLTGPSGDISFQRPMLYQDIANGKKVLAGNFIQVADNEFAFKTAHYDKTKPLVIDPSISLLYSTYLGGNEDDDATNIVIDAENNSYVVGHSFSEDFPVSANAYQPQLGNTNAAYNAVLLKFDSSGDLLYSTYLGGSGQGQYEGGESAGGIAIDGAGNAYISGSTNSLNFPVTSNAYQTTPGSGFFAEISPDGSALEYSTYWAAGTDGLALNPTGKVVIVGTAGPGLPTTTGAYKPTLATGNAAYAAIFDLTQTGAAQLVASSYYGTDTPAFNSTLTGNSQIGFALDASGDVWLGGLAATPNLPTTPNAFQTSLPGLSSDCNGFNTLNSAAYFAELSPDLRTLRYGTYFSGKVTNAVACSEFVNTMAFDTQGNLYVGGGTASNLFPVTAGTFQSTYPGNSSNNGYSSWVAKFNPASFTPTVSAPIWSSYLGGNGGNTFFGNGRQLAPDASGNVWVAGETQSGSNFPITAGAYQSKYQGSYDGYVAEISADGSQELYGTYLGGSSGANVTGLAVDSADNVYLVGDTASLDFPLTSNALQSQFANGNPSHYGNDMFFSILGTGTIGTGGPSVGGNTGDTTITINGAGFQSGANCELVQGTTTIVAAAAVVNATGTGATCTFALSGASTGSYDIVLANPNGGSTFTKPGVFTVQSGGQPNLSVSIIGRAVIRTGTPSTFYVNVTNSGNEDAYAIPLWITLPDTAVFSANTSFQQESEPLTYDIGGVSYIGLIVWQVTSGQSVTLPLQVTSPGDSIGIALTADLQAPWYSTSAEELAELTSGTYSPVCNSDPANGYFLDCFGPYMVAIGLGQPFLSSIDGSGLTAANRPQASGPVPHFGGGSCFDDPNFKAGQRQAYTDHNAGKYNNSPPPGLSSTAAMMWMAGYSFQWNNGAAPPPAVSSFLPADSSSTCMALPAPPPNLPPPAMQKFNSSSAADPNYKSGPSGDGSASQFVRGYVPLTYAVGFENEATATLPAATVVVTDQLDPTKVDLSTLSLGTISFGSNVISLPSGTTNYSTVYTPPGVTTYQVRIEGSLNPSTGLLKWTFQTIDPTTHLPPTDPTVGFLPPDADGIVGQGAVLFNVMPKSALSTGTQITNTATVVFDTNAPINTPTWLNTIDANAPTSSVAPLPATETSTTFTVAWSGTDVGSGIASYTIYVSDNGGAFTAWQSAVPTTSATYTGVSGHTYGFYSIATDGAGNIEAAKASADTSTTVKATLASQAITFTTSAPTRAAYGSTFTVAAVGGASGNPVVFTSSGVCTNAGVAYTITSGAGMCSVIANQAGNANYSAAPQVAQTVTASTATQTINFTALPATEFINSSTTLTATASSTLPVSFTSLTPISCTVSGATVSFIAVGTCTVQASQAGNSNYAAATSQTRMTVVQKLVQTISFALPNSPVALTSTKLTTNSSAGLPVTYTSSTPGVCSITGDMLSFLTSGTCDVTGAQAGNATYSAAASVMLSALVAGAPQSITFGALPASQLQGTSVSLTASATSALAVSFSSLTPSVCTVSASKATLTNPGTCSIQAAQAGNAVYAAAATVSRSLTVIAAFTITPKPPSETVRRGNLAAFILQLKAAKGFTGSVTLSCSGGPTGSYCKDFPMRVSFFNGQAFAVSAIFFPKTTPPGTYIVTFTGVSGSISDKTTATFTVF